MDEKKVYESISQHLDLMNVYLSNIILKAIYLKSEEKIYIVAEDKNLNIIKLFSFKIQDYYDVRIQEKFELLKKSLQLFFKK